MPCLMRNGLNYTGGGGGGSGSANIVELTQAEYDALGEEKNGDDTLYLITDEIPSVLDNAMLLWENPNPSVAFAEQDITLASDNYDVLELFYRYNNTASSYLSIRFLKEMMSYMHVSSSSAASGNEYFRNVIPSSNIELHIADCISNGNTGVQNGICIPYRIYGYKLHGSYSSTPDETEPTPTVDSAGIFSYEETRIGTWMDGKPLYRKMIDFGALPSSAGSKQINHGIPDIKSIHMNDGYSYFKQASVDNTYSMSHDEISAVMVNKSVIRITVTTNLSAYNAMICIEYTKTTDAAET